MFIARQRLGKHVPRQRISKQQSRYFEDNDGNGVFCVSVQRLYNEDNRPDEIIIIIITRVEVGLNTSTVTLRVVGGDEKGSLKCETEKYGLKSQRTRTRERLRWQGQQHIQRTDPSSRQRGRPTRTRP
jgi:hypothetical protein